MKVIRFKKDCLFKIDKTKIYLMLVLIAMHQGFYMIPTYIFGIMYDYILFVCVLIVDGLYLVRYKEKAIIGKFKIIPLAVPVLCLFSSLAANVNYGQSMISGLLTQRAWMSTMFLYFPFVKMIYKENLTYKKFEDVLYPVVFIELIIYFTQFLIGGSHMFLYVNHNYRYETLRLYCSTNYMFLAYIISLQMLLKKNNIKRNIAYILGILTYIVVVNKGRGEIASFLLCGAIIILFSKTHILYKVGISLTTLCVGFLTILKSKVFNEFTAIIFKGKSDYTYSVRLFSREFFLKRWKDSILSVLIGYGYPNSNSYKANIATGATQGYLLADNGVFGYLMCYGILGVFVFLYYVATIFKCSMLRFKRDKDVLIIAILAKIIFQLSTGVDYFITFYSFGSVLIMIFCELMTSDISNRK